MQLQRLVLLLSGLALAACHSAPPLPLPEAAAPWSPRAEQGVDLATNAGDVLNELKASGVDFVARYYREPTSRWPALSVGEAQLLSQLGLKIVVVWESHSRTPAHFTYASGYNDALMAAQQARGLGQPAGSAIYFAVDFNAQSRALNGIDEYFRGIAAGLAAANGVAADYAVGVYGSGAVCDAVKEAGLAQYCWLSNSIAWTGSIGYDGWNIRQGGRVPELSFNHDADEARAGYGAFQVAGDTVGVAGPVASRDPAPRFAGPSGPAVGAATLAQRCVPASVAAATAACPAM